MESLTADPALFTIAIVGGSICFFVVIFGVSMLAFIPMFKMLFKTLGGMSNVSKLQQTGLDAQGTIQQIQDTGTLINHNPLILITVQYNHPISGGTHTVQVRQVVSQIRIPAVQPGNTVAIKVDQNDENNIAIML